LWLGAQGPMTGEGVSAALKRRARDAGVDGFHVHLLRHTFAHLWQAKGGSEADLLTLGGWRDPAVMRRYGAARQVDRALAHYDDVDLLGDLR
jgi:integrase